MIFLKHLAILLFIAYFTAWGLWPGRSRFFALAGKAFHLLVLAVLQLAGSGRSTPGNGPDGP